MREIAAAVTLVTGDNKGHLMSNAGTPNRWFQGWRSGQRPTQADPADMGTAFGLEASFDEAERAPHAKPAAAKPGWIRRLSLRGKRPA